MPTFDHIGILHHPKNRNRSNWPAKLTRSSREQWAATIWHESAWEEEAVLRHLQTVDLLITLGGDGTLLRAARMGAAARLAHAGRQDGAARLSGRNHARRLAGTPVERVLARRLLAGRAADGQRPCRTRAANQPAPVCICEYDALNDVVLSRGDLARVVRISAELDGGYLTTYTCDGLIVSTATGSTGYALAVGGPILPPELGNILVIPIAPHLSMDRAIVLSEGSEVRLQAFADYRPMLTVDGQVVVELQDGDQVVIVGSPPQGPFRTSSIRSYFYQTLMDKLRWTDGRKES